MSARTIFRLATLLLLGAAIGVALFWLPAGRYLVAFAERVRALGVWGPVLLAAVYALAAVLFVPGWILTLAAGFLFGVLKGTVTVSLASVAGASAAFWLGRSVARVWVQHKFAANSGFQAIQTAVNRQGFKIVLLIRLSPIFPYAFSNYALSLTTIRFRDFLLASWIGMLPGTILYVYVGSTAESITELTSGTYQRGSAQTLLFVLGLLATVAVTVVVTRAARSAVRNSAGIENAEVK